MKDTEIIETLRSTLGTPGGRHLYGVLGSYRALDAFTKKLSQARTLDGRNFPRPLNVNRGILETIHDDDFRQLVENEAKKPEPTAAQVSKAFESFLRGKLRGKGLVTLANLELIFVYRLELTLLRTLAADEDRILLLLPGRRTGGRVVLFPKWEDAEYSLPTNLIAADHLWEIKE